MQVLAIVSGGLDSVTLAHLLASERRLGGVLSFDYGQRHKKELAYAEACARRLSAPYLPVDLSSLTRYLKDSALTDKLDVPEGHYAADNMKQTVVPNRNAIMLAVAFGIAPAQGMGAVAAAFHGGDHFIYPDCRPDFAELFEGMEQKALDGLWNVKLLTPFIHGSKTDIARRAAELNVPVAETWSCYKGGDIHCGRCGTCVERREAFYLAGVDDPTVYKDNEFWISEIKKHNQ